MSQPQQTLGPAPFRDYRPASYSPVSNAPYNSQHSQNASPRLPGNSSPLSPLQTGFPVGTPGFVRAHNPSPGTPVMAQAYNPQQWSREQMGFQRVLPPSSSTRDATGMEASMPSPPPPYSPEPATESASRARASPLLEQSIFCASPATVETSSSSNIAAALLSPTMPMSPSFPPPPSANTSRAHRDRSASGNRLFNPFQSLSGRGKQPTASESSLQGMQHMPQQDERPPAARRAASAGQVPSASSTPVRVLQRHDGGQWQSGVALPGPPPGPPPSNSRSQSLNRPMGGQLGAASSDVPQQARRTATSSTLGPVPPTPANWNDGDAIPNMQTSTSSQQYQPLRINTGEQRETSLTRRPATRDSSATGLRERRSRSKAAQADGEDVPASAVDRQNPSPMAATASGTISQRREHNRKISVLADPHQSSPSMQQGGLANLLTPPYTPAVGQRAPNSASSDRPTTRDGALSSKLPASVDVFYKQALERYRMFLEKEAIAATDEARLEAFANYIVHESRLRRDRYQAAYNNMAGDIVDLTRDMWRSYSHTSRRAQTPNAIADPVSTTSEGFPRSDSSTGDFTPATENGSIDGDNLEHAASRQWGESFKPCLSPIPSMAVSSVHDDSSRGRAPSRWWEKSEASGSIGKPERIEKSHRETKYMGINPALLRSSPQPSPEVSRSTPTPGASSFALGPDEYPPEKVGWHEANDLNTPLATPSNERLRKISDASNQMDLSRLVTLPPPYPRHHPAINNSHPLLNALRNQHRQLADTEDIRRIKDGFIDQEWSMRRKQQDEAKNRRAKLRRSMQEKLTDGDISFAEAAQAESKFEENEIERAKSNARALFDAFEAAVSHPLNTLITEKLATAEKSIQSLQSDLAKHNKSSDPNRAQEEGDEHPERLEKLTLLKWLFEAREVLHKEMYELHAQRAEKYGEVVLTPYRIAKQQNKIEEAEAFFFKDGRQRAIVFNKESLKRHEEFQSRIEVNVNSGVEDQLSAFWDIAPGLKEVVQQIPAVITENGQEKLQILDRFQFFVPPQEVQENPAYNRFPLQYLYSVLSHAEKSTYQFIESQTNLWCLLHAVRETTAEASLRLIELETSSGGADFGKELHAEMLQAKSAEEKRMTADLQEKVGEIERQWKEALGEQLMNVKLGVRHRLEETGGWEDGLDG